MTLSLIYRKWLRISHNTIFYWLSQVWIGSSTSTERASMTKGTMRGQHNTPYTSSWSYSETENEGKLRSGARLRMTVSQPHYKGNQLRNFLRKEMIQWVQAIRPESNPRVVISAAQEVEIQVKNPENLVRSGSGSHACVGDHTAEDSAAT